jgi:hypothetical protein
MGQRYPHGEYQGGMKFLVAPLHDRRQARMAFSSNRQVSVIKLAVTLLGR